MTKWYINPNQPVTVFGQPGTVRNGGFQFTYNVHFNNGTVRPVAVDNIVLVVA